MTESTDGFFISEQDLKLRGSGEIFGMRQSGEEGFLLADLYQDLNMLRCAREEAKVILENEDKNSRKLVFETEKTLEKSKNYLCFN